MKYALFLGCTIPARARNYELSARKVAERLGLELVGIEDFLCCGFPAKSSDIQDAYLLGAYNLALARSRDLDICALCSSCTSALSEAAHHLSLHEEDKVRINQRLAPAGLQLDEPPEVRHFARILFEDMDREAIQKALSVSLKGLRVAIHYGCHYLKPSSVHHHFDDVEEPRSIDELVALTGAEVVDYPGKKMCCGGPVLPVDEKLAMTVAKQKLDALAHARVDALCLVCPFCSVMYDGNQKGIETQYQTSYNLPVLYLTQVLGLAMGFGSKELGLNMNVVKTKDLVSRFGG